MSILLKIQPFYILEFRIVEWSKNVLPRQLLKIEMVLIVGRIRDIIDGLKKNVAYEHNVRQPEWMAVLRLNPIYGEDQLLAFNVMKNTTLNFSNTVESFNIVGANQCS